LKEIEIIFLGEIYSMAIEIGDAKLRRKSSDHS